MAAYQIGRQAWPLEAIGCDTGQELHCFPEPLHERISDNTDPAAHATAQMRDKAALIVQRTLLQGLQALHCCFIFYFTHSKLSAVFLYPALHLVPFTSHIWKIGYLWNCLTSSRACMWLVAHHLICEDATCHRWRRCKGLKAEQARVGAVKERLPIQGLHLMPQGM